jgi:2-methylcitrate dehydratase PrpD
MTLTERWAEFLSGTRFEDLPAEVVAQTKLFILDSIGCALGGYTLSWGKKVVALGRDLGGKAESRVIGSGERTSSTTSAYVNAKLSNIMDMDETLYNNRHIGGVPVFPATSIGERVGASGKTVILATALGYDLAARAGLCGSAFSPDKEKGVVVSGNAASGFNTLGAAASAAKTCGFNKEQMLNALGICVYFAPGGIESKFTFTPPGNFEKYGDTGQFCWSGVMTALCVQNGYIGDQTIFDGPRGLPNLLGVPKFDYDTFMADLGQHWYILEAGFKPWPICRWFHPGIKMLEDIMKGQHLKPEDIQKIIIRTHPMLIELPTFKAAADWANSGKELWLSVDSITYALACAVYGLTPGPDWVKEESLKSPKIAEMTRKIVNLEHPDVIKKMAAWTGHPGKIFSQAVTSLEVITSKGTFKDESADVPGDSWNPRSRLTRDQLIAKFKNNAREILSEAKMNSLIEAVEALDKIKNVSELMKLTAA